MSWQSVPVFDEFGTLSYEDQWVPDDAPSSSDLSALYGDAGYGAEPAPEPQAQGMSSADRAALYSDVGYAGQANAGDPAWMTRLQGLTNYNANDGLLGNALNFATSKLGAMFIGAALGRANTAPAQGGGYGYALNRPPDLKRDIVKGKYGPLAIHYAATGGIMHAYKHGGTVEGQAYAEGKPLTMEDGGFVMTKRAVDGAGGLAGLKQHIPGAKGITAPGARSGPQAGVDDRGITRIVARDGKTAPARVSHGEAYVPQKAVDAHGGPAKMHAAMKAFEKKGIRHG